MAYALCMAESLIFIVEVQFLSYVQYMIGFYFHGFAALVGQGLFIVEVLRSHSNTLHLVGALWMSDRPVEETST